MLDELNRGRHKALGLLSEHFRYPSRELRLDAIVCDVSDADLTWVCERMHHYILRLLEETDYDPASDESPEIIE